MKLEYKIMIGIAIVVIVGFTIIAIVLEKKFKNDWNEYCESEGLQEGCIPMDECVKECNDLGKTYLKFEGGGFFDSDDCWCLKNSETIQIW